MVFIPYTLSIKQSREVSRIGQEQLQPDDGTGPLASSRIIGRSYYQLHMLHRLIQDSSRVAGFSGYGRWVTYLWTH